MQEEVLLAGDSVLAAGTAVAGTAVAGTAAAAVRAATLHQSAVLLLVMMWHRPLLLLLNCDQRVRQADVRSLTLCLLLLVLHERLQSGLLGAAAGAFGACEKRT